MVEGDEVFNVLCGDVEFNRLSGLRFGNKVHTSSQNVNEVK